MAFETINATLPSTNKKNTTGADINASVQYDLGDNLQDAVNKFGEEAVFTAFKADATVGLQSNMRSWMGAGLSPEQIQEKADAWKPGVRTVGPRKSPKEKIETEFAKLSPEEKLAYLEQLKAQFGL